jgi:hypothetical protein
VEYRRGRSALVAAGRHPSAHAAAIGTDHVETAWSWDRLADTLFARGQYRSGAGLLRAGPGDLYTTIERAAPRYDSGAQAAGGDTVALY